MPSDYEAIRRENLEEYGHNRKGWRSRLLTELYDDRTHFLYELLQNAEDALRRLAGRGPSGRVRFTLANDSVRFSHFGDPFTTDDVEGVCGIAFSTKADDPAAIGRFGMGFKSVYEVTERPQIYSGDEHFAVEDYVLPIEIPQSELADGETVIVLPGRKGGPSQDELASGLARLGVRTLLFLREINEIAWSVEGEPSGVYSRPAEEAVGEGVRRVRVRAESDGEKPIEETWLVFSREVRNGDEESSRVELAFRVEADESGSDVITSIDDSRLVVFFPTAIETHLGLLIQGPYRTTQNRANVLWQDEWNQRLVGGTADLLVDALCHLRDRGLLSVHVFDALPLSRSHFPKGSHFAPLFDAVKDAVARERLLPTYLGEPVAASQARLTPSPGLRKLVARSRLAELVGANEPVAWLSGDIRRNTTLHAYLRREHGVEEITASSFLRTLGKRFLEAQPDGWIRRLYEFLQRERRKDAALARALDDAYIPPLVRLEDGTHTEPEDWSGDRLLLPTTPPSGLPNTVLPAVCDSELALAFLESLGVSEPDPVDELIPDVVPRYRNQGAMDLSAHPDDLRRIVEIFNGASRSARDWLAEALRETYFIRAVDAGTPEPSFVRPHDVYLRTKGLRGVFDGVSGVLFPASPPKGVSAADMARLLEACGAWRTLASTESEASVISDWYSKDYQDLAGVSPQERREMRRRAGEPEITEGRRETVTNRQFRGLKELLGHLPTLPAEDRATRAELLWDALRDAAEVPGQPGFRGNYNWFRRKERFARFDSASVRLLNETAWVPDRSGNLQPPSNVEFGPLGWRPDSFLESIIKFREPERTSSRAVAAKAIGVSVELMGSIEELKEQGVSDDEIQDALALIAARRARTGLGSGGSTDGGGADVGRSGDPAGPGGVGGLTHMTGGNGGAVAGPTGGGERTAGVGTEVGGTRAANAGMRAGGGRSSGAGGTRSRFVSYISVRTESEGDPDPDGLSDDKRKALEAAAISRILEEEPTLERTRTNNPGFDLYEVDESGTQVRWVEVKAMSRDMRSRPATMSHTQFDFARQKGEAYSLYVVEHAGTDAANIVKIRNPAGQASTYTFDHGWRAAAEGTDGDG